MNRCSNCMHEGDDVVLALPTRQYFVCQKCAVTYGKDRFGNTFTLGEEVHMKAGFSAKVDSRTLIITGIFIFEEAESGRMVTLKDKETDKPLKREVDINWLKKMKP